MFLWIVLAIALLVGTCMLLQGLVMYLRPNFRQGARSRPSAAPRALRPDLVALEAQYFLCPTRALAEAGELLRTAGNHEDLLAGVVDLPSFSNALREAQAYIPRESTSLVRARGTATLK
jgi:hypothetical protein